MRVTESGDPRLEELFGVKGAQESGVRPVVRLPRQGLPGWAIALIAAFGALLLFWVLESHRTAAPEPSVRASGPGAYVEPEPPPLYIPPAPAPVQPQVAPVIAPAPLPAPKLEQRPAPAPAPMLMSPQPMPVMAPQPPLPQPRTSTGPALVIDTTAGSPRAGAGATEPGSAAAVGTAGSQWGGRVRASSLANRSDTVPQGVLIPAVLETAFDSTSAGLARAIVSHDVRGFDGTKVLIPRGSRLIGEYGADVAAGQKRALITWTRLIRPDGVTIALDSPATDTLGRGGVKAHVNSHVLERFLNAFLRTSVDVGSAVATRTAAGSVIIAAPGAFQNSASPIPSNTIVPTLSIPAGTSISIFVARDLQFPDSGESGE